ncbi:MAG TPA: hypothetical protein VF816_10820 [Rhodocyclaceae bacterium]
MFHPATLLLAWAGFAFALPALPLRVLAGLLVLVLILALWLARPRALALWRRARWLLLSIAVLFAFATPGLLVPGLPGRLGVTIDGLQLAGEHIGRLLLLLTSLALLHERLGTRGLVSGLYWLLGPLSRWPGLRERIVVRLMLVVEFVENDRRGAWRDWLEERQDAGPAQLPLEVRTARWHDRVAMLALACALAVLAW